MLRSERHLSFLQRFVWLQRTDTTACIGPPAGKGKGVPGTVKIANAAEIAPSKSTTKGG